MSQRSHQVYVNGHTVNLRLSHRPTPDPTLVTISSTVTLTTEEVAAVLFEWISNGGYYTELDDDARVRLLIAESAINGGCLHVDELRDAATPMHNLELWGQCEQRAREVFEGATTQAAELITV